MIRLSNFLTLVLLVAVHLAVWFCSSPVLMASEGNPRAALQKEIRQMEREVNFTPRDTAYINRLNRLAAQMRYYSADSLYNLAKKALKHSKETAFALGESQAYKSLADYYSDLGNTKKAIEYYRIALKLAGQSKDTELRLGILNNLSGEYAYEGDYSSALNGYLEALEIAQTSGNLLMQSILNENIAGIYTDQKEYDEALSYYKKVKRINDSIGNEIINAETLSNLASLYADMGKLEYAMFSVNQSIDILEEHRILDWLAFAYETKGKVYLKKYNYKWALYWYNQSALLHRDIDDERSRIDLLNGMSQAHFGQGNDSLASVYATEAFAISERINFVNGTRDCAKALYQIYRKKEDYATALAYHELYQQLSDSLSRSENRQSLLLHKTKNEYESQKQELILQNEKALAQQKRYIRIGGIILFIAVIIIYLVLRSKRLQKRLTAELQANQEILEKRKEELQANNETKTKLFSIIGHDLRGPIGALQGLLKLFKDGEVSREEFLSFIPKLRADVDHIYFTLNNLLSWGHTQLNGSVTKPSVVTFDHIVEENINLLTEIAEQKSIRIINKIEANIHVWSDPNQIDIVVRNLISNALKFTPENGMVTVEAVEREENWEIAIRDTGVGMDRITLGKLFQEKTNHSTYGTNNEKGTGLGLSLCKEMVEKNNGKIWADSMLRKGSSFYFTLPKARQELGKAV